MGVILVVTATAYSNPILFETIPPTSITYLAELVDGMNSVNPEIANFIFSRVDYEFRKKTI